MKGISIMDQIHKIRTLRYSQTDHQGNRKPQYSAWRSTERKLSDPPRAAHQMFKNSRIESGQNIHSTRVVVILLQLPIL